MNFSKKNHELLHNKVRTVSKTMKFTMNFLIAFVLVVLAACQKDNLQDAIIPATSVEENTNATNAINGTDGTDGQNGTDGEDGEDGADGQDGADGEQGPPGPEGPQGEQGPQGEAGPAGPQGPVGADGADGTDGADGPDGQDGQQGEPGTANVIYSDWFPTEFGETIDDQSSSFTISAPQMTTDILNFGTILVYGKRQGVSVPGFGGSLLVFQLPYEISALEVSYQFSASRSAFASQIRITIRETDDDGTISEGGNYLQHFRYVLIPGGMSSRGKSSTVDYAKMSYEELAAHFNIPD